MPDKSPAISREKQKLLFRVKRLRGQFAAVERALTAGDECADILMLLAAIRGGVNGLMAEILEDHIRLHMMTPDQKMESPEELGEDLIGLVRAYLKIIRPAFSYTLPRYDINRGSGQRAAAAAGIPVCNFCVMRRCETAELATIVSAITPVRYA